LFLCTEVQAVKDQLARVELAQSEQQKTIQSALEAIATLSAKVNSSSSSSPAIPVLISSSLNQSSQPQQLPLSHSWPIAAPSAPPQQSLYSQAVESAQPLTITFNSTYVPNVQFTLGYTAATRQCNTWATLVAQQVITRQAARGNRLYYFQVHVRSCDDSKTGGLIIGLADASTLNQSKDNYMLGQLGMDSSPIVCCGLRKNDAGLCGGSQWPIIQGNTFAYGKNDTITITVNWNTNIARFACNNEWFEIGNLPDRIVPVVSLGYANQTVAFTKTTWFLPQTM